jgi:2-dehydro-3-deoxygluconokinase
METEQGPQGGDAAAPELVCVGESMVMFVPEPPLPISASATYRPTVAGAESNVAAFGAALGVRTTWVSRVGDDQFGRYVVNELTGHGVDVGYVEPDLHRPTGVAFKEPSPAGTRVTYFRHGSAASAMDEKTAEMVRSLRGRALHLSGITPALSDSCQALVQELVEHRDSGSTVSFDVNWRPKLWRNRDPGILLQLARASDIVFVGHDEAQALWGVTAAADVRRLLPEPPMVVVKQGAVGATAFVGKEAVFVPAFDMRVVEPVGAGDGFAAGFLAGTLRDLDLRERLRLGTIVASSALRVPSDVGPLPPPANIEALLGLTDDEWRDARFGPFAGQVEE